MSSSRREFLGAAAVLWQQAAARAQQHAHQAPAAGLPYRYQFFSEAERSTVMALAARIVPADERSGGAVEARADEYIDFVLAHAQAPLQRQWRTALRKLAPRVQGAKPEQFDALLKALAASEFSPRTADEEFFVLLKGAVVEAFYTSQPGILKELGYAGGGFVKEFPGCTHSAHEAPASYRPLIRQRSR